MSNRTQKSRTRIRGRKLTVNSLKQLREQRDWSQADFASEFAKWAHSQGETTIEIDASSVSRAERGLPVRKDRAPLLERFVQHLQKGDGQNQFAVARNAPGPPAEASLRSSDVNRQVALGDNGRRLLEESKKAYIQGFVRKSLALAERAKESAWPNVSVGTRVVTCLLRFGHSRWNEIRGILDQLAQSTPSGPELGTLRLLNAEFLARNKHWDDALAELASIQEESARRDYQQGMCHLALCLHDEKQCESNIVAARACFAGSYKLRPEWWYTTLNLALVDRVNDRPNKELERWARQQIDAAIEKHPMKSSARFYRLLHIIMTERDGELASMIDHDHATCPETLEVSQDFYDTMALRVRLLHGTSAKAKRILKELRRWPEQFSLLK